MANLTAFGYKAWLAIAHGVAGSRGASSVLGRGRFATGCDPARSSSVLAGTNPLEQWRELPCAT
jgi:hypothetical protein